ncbi:MAG: hypothetical protein O7D33_04070 [Chloroflexi bacterium]|nr:hypothetical protein [Chloroflexota bacterium]
MTGANGAGSLPAHDGETSAACLAVVDRFRNSLAEGEAWPIALLTAVGKWGLPYEEIDGRRYQYLLLGEAFDWLVLAERLLNEVDGLVPQEEKEALLFSNTLPQVLQEADFRNLLGGDKYRGHLNFFYGVVVEESLLLAVEEEVRKQRRSRGFSDSEQTVELAYRRIYSESRDALLGAFRQELGLSDSPSLTLTELKEFTYWLFKRRFTSSDSSRVASDTKKGLERLMKMHRPNQLPQ